MTLLMNRSSGNTSSPTKTTEASYSEIESLQKELEDLLCNASNRYQNLQTILNPEEEAKIKARKLETETSLEEVTRKKSKEQIKPPVGEPGKRFAFFKESEEIEKQGAVSDPNDKNRSEHVERFWAAVNEYVGIIPQETLNFLKNITECEARDQHLTADKVLVKTEQVVEESTEAPPTKKRKKSSKSDKPVPPREPKTITKWEYQLKAAEDKPLTSQQESKMKEGVQQNSFPSPGFGELSTRIVSALIEEGIEPEISEAIQKMIHEGGESSKKEADVETQSIQMENKFASDLEQRIASQLMQEGLLSAVDCVSFLNKAGDSGVTSGDDGQVSQVNDAVDECYIDYELRQLREELGIVQRENAITAKNLLKKALQHNRRHHALKNLENIDYSLLDHYKKIQTARTRRKPLTKKEKDNIAALLDKRQDALNDMR